MLRVSSAPVARKGAGANVAATEDSPQAKWLRESQEALRNQQPANSIRNSAKQAAMNKVGLLKQRLEALKSLLRFASPEMARRLANELKNIASELASIAKSLGSNSGGGTSAAVAGAAPTEAQDAEAGAAEAEAAVAADDSGVASSAAVATENSSDAQGAQGDDDGALKALLRDARKVLKDVIDQFKAKLGHADPETKRDIEAAVKSLADLDKALSQANAAAFYTGPGDIGGAVSMSATSGALVDFTA